MTPEVWSVDVAPGDGPIATMDSSASVRVFDGASGEELAVLAGHRGRPSGLWFSPDGRRLATASEDGAVLVWDVAGATAR
jgi:WD40 repeat protein